MFHLMFGRHLKKTKRFDTQFHLTVVSVFLKTCVKGHGDSSYLFATKKELISMYHGAHFGLL